MGDIGRFHRMLAAMHWESAMWLAVDDAESRLRDRTADRSRDRSASDAEFWSIIDADRLLQRARRRRRPTKN